MAYNPLYSNPFNQMSTRNNQTPSADTYLNKPNQVSLLNTSSYQTYQQPQTVQPASQLSVEDLSTPTDINIPEPSNVDNTSSAMAGYKTQLDSLQKQIKALQSTPETTAAETTNKSLTQKLTDYLNGITDKSAMTTEMTTAAGIPEQQKQLQDLTQQAINLNAQYETTKANLEGQGRGIPIQILSAQQNRLAKQQAIEVGRVTALATAIQGNITLAKQNIKDTVDLEFEDDENRINGTLKLIELNQANMTAAEKKRAEELAPLLEEQKALIEQQKEEKKTIGSWALKALEGGLGTESVKKMLSSNTLEEAVQYAGDSLGADDLDTIYKTLQIQKLQKELTSDTGGEMDDKQRAIFNQIVNKYSTSPLIAAQDRTIVLKNIVEQIKANPKDGALQLGLVYSYVQALDTYQSAVREGELSLVNSIDSKYGQLKNSIEKIENGQIVRPEVAKQIASAAETLVRTIDEGATKKEKMFRSQAQVNKIEGSWDEFISGFKGIETNTKTIDDYRQEFPKATDEELQQLMEEERSFSKVGGDTNKAVVKAASIPTGSKQGQCGRFVNKLTGLGLGDSYQSKIAKMNPKIKNPKPGMVFVMPYKNTGHTGIILSIKNGIATVKDSNWSLDEKVKVHQIPVSKMTGFNYA